MLYCKFLTTDLPCPPGTLLKKSVVYPTIPHNRTAGGWQNYSWGNLITEIDNPTIATNVKFPPETREREMALTVFNCDLKKTASEWKRMIITKGFYTFEWKRHEEMNQKQFAQVACLVLAVLPWSRVIMVECNVIGAMTLAVWPAIIQLIPDNSH